MSEERLEEIKQYLIHFYNAVDVEEDIKVYIFNTLKIEWLIEQAERVQELEDIIYKDERQAVLEGMYEENKRLREALEEIKKEETVTTALSEGRVAYTFSGHIARKALEGKQ